MTLPGLGETIKAGQGCGDIESVKSVNDQRPGGSKDRGSLHPWIGGCSDPR